MSSFIKGCLQLKVVFHRSLSSIKGRLPAKVVFYQQSFSIIGHLSSKVVFHRRSSSNEGCLPSKVVFHRKRSSIKGRLPYSLIVSDILLTLLIPVCFDIILASKSFARAVVPVRRGWFWTQWNSKFFFLQILLFHQFRVKTSTKISTN